MKIDEIKERYKDEWVLIEVVKTNELGEPIEGNVIAHSKNRDETYEAMKKTQARDIAHFYTGKIPKKGYAVEFSLFPEEVENHNKPVLLKFQLFPLTILASSINLRQFSI